MKTPRIANAIGQIDDDLVADGTTAYVQHRSVK